MLNCENKLNKLIVGGRGGITVSYSILIFFNYTNYIYLYTIPISMLPRNTCKRCNHTWIPRTDDTPTICPSCKSPYWNKERREGTNVNNKL